MKKLFLLIILVVLVGCANTPPAPESDSPQDYKMGSAIPVDDNVYLVAGEVVGDIKSMTEIKGESSIYGYGSMSGGYGYGYMSGSSSLWQEGKGLIRLMVESISPASNLARPGDMIVIKTTDRKLAATLVGDRILVKCRAQYEAIAAVREAETFNSDKFETWELDYCRMVTPKIGTAK